MPPDHEHATTTTSASTTSTSASSRVPRIDQAAVTPTLLRAYLDANAPFVLLNVASNWRATRDWVAPGEEHDFVTIDLLETAFRGHAAEVLVPVVKCRDDDAEGEGAGGGGATSAAAGSAYGEEPRSERCLAEYAALWKNGEAEARGLYLKDWHIVKALRSLTRGGRCPGAEDGAENGGEGEGEEEAACAMLSSFTSTLGGEKAKEEDDEDVGPAVASTPPRPDTPVPYYYKVPSPLDDDWLNGWWDAPAAEAGHVAREDDYRFLYLGPKGSTTGLHHDVLCSYSWSANLAGIKEWTLFPPPPPSPPPSRPPPSPLPSAASTTDTSSMLGPSLETAEQEQQVQPLCTHPTTSKASGSRTATTLLPPSSASPTPNSPAAPALVVRQGPGEVLFVPSGWHHQVRNLTGCLSINHNWFNRSSLPRVWAFLKQEARAVQARLGHLRDTFDQDVSGWERQCEVVLRANSAMNLTEWVGLLVWKAREMRRRQQAGKGLVGGDRNEARQDLGAILGVLRELVLPSSPSEEEEKLDVVSFLFPAHLRGEEEAHVEEGEAPRLPLRVDLRPRVQTWLAAEIGEMEAFLELMGV